MERKLKVVWLCHMCNDVLNAYFGIEKNMCAFWMTQFISIMQNRNVEIHIVSPNYYTNKDIDIRIDGVSYHLYKYHSILKGQKAALIEIAFRKEKNIEDKVCKIVNEINPNLVQLFGAENITYSRGIIPLFEKYPCLVTFQGYIQLTKDFGGALKRWVINRRIRTENEILSKAKWVSFGEFEQTSEQYYKKKYNGTSLLINFPCKKPDIDSTDFEKEYDIVFWARVTANKGVEDLIRSVCILKRNNKLIKCLIMGGGSEDYLNYLKKMVENLGLTQNIVFGGFQKDNDTLFRNAAKARVYVLPTLFDALPGSIREAMFMKLPVVSYPVGDIPALNKGKECLAIAKYRDIDDLASKIQKVLSDDHYRQLLVNNAYNEMQKISADDYIAGQMMDCYERIINFKSVEI